MANEILNKIKFHGANKEVLNILNFIKIEKRDCKEVNGIGTIDFNKITPMPKWIMGKNGANNEIIEKYGYKNIYTSWARVNWGTSNNAYGQPHKKNNSNTIYFFTKNKAVNELISKLAWIFPNIKIEYSYCSIDDLGCNVGRYIFKDTNIINSYCPFNGSEAAINLAKNIMGEDN